jgi:hypothetical protein
VLDFDGDAVAEVVLVDNPASFGATLFKEASDGSWRMIGTFSLLRCGGVIEGFRSGELRVVPPSGNDLEVAGQRLRLEPGCGR